MPLSGKEVVKILQKHGFVVSRQKGTLRSIAKMTEVDRKDLGV